MSIPHYISNTCESFSHELWVNLLRRPNETKTGPKICQKESSMNLIQLTLHPYSRMKKTLKVNEHEKTLHGSILNGHSYTVGVL